MISVVIPARNAAATIERAVRSACYQEGVSVEVVVVDDGSTDGTVDVAQAFAPRDARISVQRNTHANLSVARNTGIELARGEYLSFVDSDDTLANDMLEQLWIAVRRHNATAAFCGFVHDTRLIGGEVTARPACGPYDVPYGPRTAFRRLICSQNRTAVWGALYHKGLFATLRFPTTRFPEDTYTMPRLLLASPRNVAIAPCLYHYRVRNNSLSQTSSPWLIGALQTHIELTGLVDQHLPTVMMRARSRERVTSTAALLLSFVASQDGDVTRYRKRVCALLPRWKAALLFFHPLFSLTSRVLALMLVFNLATHRVAFETARRFHTHYIEPVRNRMKARR